MYRVALAVALVAVAVGAWWFASDEAKRAGIAETVGGKTAQTAAPAKPICVSPVNPNVAAPLDCIPQYIANLPPDPGEAGKATIDGIDADKDGMRDDVQRWIALEWGHSPIAVKQLTALAQLYLRPVHYGDSLGKAETRKRFGATVALEAACAFGLETNETRERGARRQVRLLVLNTPERVQSADAFDLMFANTDMPAFEGTASEACGFDVEVLAAKEDKRTIASQLRAESVAQTKREQQQEEAERAKDEARQSREAIERASKEQKK